MESDQILIRRARVIDPNSPFNNQVVDILIEYDKITSIAENIAAGNAEVFEAENLHVSPGWFDLRANFCDPGHEEKEDIESGINAAIFGGFTSVALAPDTEPAIDSKADIEYIYKKAEEFPVNVFPFGSISRQQQGEELSEMYDMYQAGAVGFSTGKKPLSNSALMKIALQYHKNFAPPLHLMPLDEHLARGGQMHEGEKSTYMGLKGIPALAEEVIIQRDLRLAEYAGTAIHFMGISSRSGVEMLREARKQGKKYTADIPVANLYFTDEDLETYDTRFKVMPPLRSGEDRNALIEALRDGTIQAVASDHYPQDIENKKCEFDHAAFGIISLESFFGALGKAAAGKLSYERIIELIAINPRQILELEIPSVAEGNMAELTFFDPARKWTFAKEHIQSKSANTPFIGKEMLGKALGICNNGIMVWLDHI